MTGDYDDAHSLARFQLLPPDLIVRVQPVDPNEFKSKGFGVDYAQTLAQWMIAHYEPIKTIGPQNFIVILKRKNI